MPHDVLPTVPEPPRARPPARPAGPVVTSLAPPSAPMSAPNGITPETGLENTVGAGPIGPPQIGAGDDIGSTIIGAAEPPPPPPIVQPVRLHKGIRPPQKIAGPLPVYPAPARLARLQGSVIIEATIDAQGNVEAARVLRPLRFLDEAALDA